MKQVISLLLFILVFVVIGTFITNQIKRSDEIEIHRFLHVESVMIESPFFNHGPYWRTKNHRVYKVTFDNKEFWFRFGGWGGYDVEEKVNGKYVVRK